MLEALMTILSRFSQVQNEKLQKMRFQLQLSSGEDQRQPILHRQNTLRYFEPLLPMNMIS